VARETLKRALRDGTVVMMGGTLVAGIATYGWQAAGTRVLGEVDFAPVATVWTIQFLVVTILLAPLEQFAIRTVAAGEAGRSHLGHAVQTLAWFAALSTAVVMILSFVLRDSFFDGEAAYALVCGAIVLGFGQLAVLRGILAGQRDFAAYGEMTALDSIVRLAIGLPLLLAGSSALAFAWTIPASTLVALLWLAHRPSRRHARPDEPPSEVSAPHFIATMVGGNSAAQIVLAGGPLVLALLGATEAAITTLFVTQTAFRAAFMVATPGWSRVLPALTRIATDREFERLSRLGGLVAAGTLAFAVLGGLAASVAAPPLIEAFFGGGVRPSGFVAGMVGAGTVIAMGNLGLSQILIAAVRTHRITGVWWGALVISLGWVVAGPGSELNRVTAAFVLGEAVALLGLTLAARLYLAESIRAYTRAAVRRGPAPRRSYQ
jgi:O-antigen/teichoic acid export membrane protein